MAGTELSGRQDFSPSLRPPKELNPLATNAAPIVIGKFIPGKHKGTYHDLLTRENMTGPDRETGTYYLTVDPKTIFVAQRIDAERRTAQPVGFASSSGNPRMVRGVVVDEAYRGGVIGTQLVLATIYEAHAQGFNQVELQVDVAIEDTALREAMSSNHLLNWYQNKETMRFVPQYVTVGMATQTRDHILYPSDLALSQAFRDVYARTQIPDNPANRGYFKGISGLQRVLWESGINPELEHVGPYQTSVMATDWHESRFEHVNRRWINIIKQTGGIRWLRLDDRDVAAGSSTHTGIFNPEGYYAVYQKETGNVIPVFIQSEGNDFTVVRHQSIDAPLKSALLESAVVYRNQPVTRY